VLVVFSWRVSSFLPYQNDCNRLAVAQEKRMVVLRQSSHHVCVFVVLFILFFIILYVECFGRTMLCMCIEYHIYVNMYHVSAQGIDERMINVHSYSYSYMDRVGFLFVLFLFLFSFFHLPVCVGHMDRPASVACCLTADGRYSLVHC